MAVIARQLRQMAIEDSAKHEAEMNALKQLTEATQEEVAIARAAAQRIESYVKHRGSLQQSTSASTQQTDSQFYSALSESKLPSGSRLQTSEALAPGYILDAQKGAPPDFFGEPDFPRYAREERMQAFSNRNLGRVAETTKTMDHYDTSSNPVFDTGDMTDTVLTFPGLLPNAPNVIFIIEWKRWPKLLKGGGISMTFSPAEKGQVLGYAFQTLDAQKWRTKIVVMLCNYDICQFFEVTRAKGTAYTATEFQVIAFAQGIGRDILYGIMHLEPKVLGFDVVFPTGLDAASVSAWSGGASGVVFKSLKDETRVIKTFRDSTTQSIEIAAYEALHIDRDDIPICTLLEAGADVNYIVLSNVGSNASPFTPTVAFANVVTALQHMHRRGIVHRDVRPANIAVQRTPDGKLVATLIDLSAVAVLPDYDNDSLPSTTDSERFCGTRTFATSETRKDVSKYGTCDDLVSLVRTVIFLKELHGMGVPRSGTPAEEVDGFWDSLELPKHFMNMMNAAKTSDYDTLKELLEA